MAQSQLNEMNGLHAINGFQRCWCYENYGAWALSLAYSYSIPSSVAKEGGLQLFVYGQLARQQNLRWKIAVL